MEPALIVEKWVKQVPKFELTEGYIPEIVFPAQTFTLARCRCAMADHLEYLLISSCLYSLPASVRGSCASKETDRGHL